MLFKHHFPSLGVPYQTRLLLCGMKSLETRPRNALFLLLFKLLNNEIKCDTLVQLVSFQVPVRQTRQQQLFHVRLHRTNYGLTAFVDRMLMNYNRFYADCDIFRFKLPRIKFLIAQKWLYQWISLSVWWFFFYCIYSCAVHFILAFTIFCLLLLSLSA